MSWIKFPTITHQDLSIARLQLHEAAQIIAAIGISFVTKQDDDSHTNLEWLPSLHAFAGGLFNNGKLRTALQTDTLSILLLDADNQQLAYFALNGHTQTEAVEALKKMLQQKGFDVSAMTMKKHYEITSTPQAQGKPYQFFNKAAFDTLTAHFNNAQLELERVMVNHPGASDIRLWPHHFDLGLLLPLSSGDNAKSISMGFSPGDVHYDTPYYYVSPWPYPGKDKLDDADLQSGGYWHKDDFIAAVLLAKDYTESENPEDAIAGFMDSAVMVCTKLLGF